MKCVPWKDHYTPITADPKRIYQSATEGQTSLASDQLSESWDEKYPKIDRSCPADRDHINTLFNYLEDIRKRYTRRMPLSRRIASFAKPSKTQTFPIDDSAKKAIYRSIRGASKQWAMSIRNRSSSFNHFMIEFDPAVTQNYLLGALKLKILALHETNYVLVGSAPST